MFISIFLHFDTEIIEIHLRSESYPPYGKWIWTFMKGWITLFIEGGARVENMLLLYTCELCDDIIYRVKIAGQLKPLVHITNITP